MKIIKETPTELVIKITPTFLTIILGLIWIAGIAGFVIPLLCMGLILNGDTIINCARLNSDEVNCQFHEVMPVFNVIPIKTSKYNYINAMEFKNLEKTSEGSKYTHFYMLFKTRYGDIPIHEYSLLRQRQEDTVKKINAFLKSQVKSITITQGSFLGLFAVLLIGLIIGSVTVVFIAFEAMFKIVNLTINKCDNKISGSSLSILGLWKYSFDIKEIKSIEIDEAAGSHADLFTPMIVIQSGKRIFLWSGYNKKIAVTKANKVRDFLDLPTEDLPE
jgi:hypothetical protein